MKNYLIGKQWGCLVVLILIFLQLLFSNRAFSGCYCMMESKSVGASYNKTGFYDGTCQTNMPIEIFLHQEDVVVSKVIKAYNYGSSTYNLNWSFKQTLNQQYDLSNITNLSNPHYTGCATYTLPYSSVLSGGEIGDAYNSFNNGYEDLNWSQSYYSDYFTNLCDGSWVEVDSVSPGSSSGSMCDDSFPSKYIISDATEYDIWVETINTCSPTLTEYERVYNDSYSDDSWHETVTRSQPFTDVMLRGQIIARIPDWPTNWTGGTGMAYCTLTDDHICGGGGKMQYRVKVPDSQKFTAYLLQWSEVTQYPNTTNTTSVTQTEQVIGTGDPINPAVGQTHTVDMPGSPCTIYETAPEIIKITTSSNGGGPPGAPPGTGGHQHGAASN